jgi:hypothetical protein
VFMSCCPARHWTESFTKMSFTIIKNLEQLPSYLMLCKLAEQHRVNVTGNEHTGSFSCRGVEGDYAIEEDGIRGKIVSHGVTGMFSLESGKATITVIEKPFWLPKLLLTQKITEGLDTIWHELAQLRLS